MSEFEETTEIILSNHSILQRGNYGLKMPTGKELEAGPKSTCRCGHQEKYALFCSMLIANVCIRNFLNMIL